MPEPSVLREYNDVVPGAADRILRAFESATVQAADRDDRLADADISIRKTGAGWATFLLLACIAAAIVFFALGNNTAGTILLGAPVLISLVSILTTAMGKLRPRDRPDD